jgi:hypothetical protein
MPERSTARRVYLLPVVALAISVIVAGRAEGAGLSGGSSAAGTIVFVSDRGGHGALYAIDPADGQLSQVVATSADLLAPAPDGHAVA